MDFLRETLRILIICFILKSTLAEVQLTTLDSKIDIYYERFAKIRIHSSNWRLYSIIDLSTLNQEIQSLNDIIIQMSLLKNYNVTKITMHDYTNILELMEDKRLKLKSTNQFLTDTYNL
jgi:hypothetical protein